MLRLKLRCRGSAACHSFVAAHMSYVQLASPLNPAQLDELLAMGWYRMQQHVFTTHALHFEDGLVAPVFWARVVLLDFQPNSRHKRLSRLNSRFQLSLQSAAVDAEIEALFTCYREAIDFETGPGVRDILFEAGSTNFFSSKMWQLRDSGRLIAVGYFDEGIASAAGILNFFHPDYRKYSPGLWLYLENLRHAAEQGRSYFYPGYIALNFPKFDYKLLAGEERTELYDARRSVWVPYGITVHAARRKGNMGIR